MEERINKVVQSTIADKKMSRIMFAVIATHSKILDTLTFERKKSRKDQSGNFVEYLVSIPASQVDRFEELAEIKLQEPERIVLNSGDGK